MPSFLSIETWKQQSFTAEASRGSSDNGSENVLHSVGLNGKWQWQRVQNIFLLILKHMRRYDINKKPKFSQIGLFSSI